MSDYTRRRFLTGLGIASGALAVGGGAVAQTRRVPMQVEATQGWLTWINATTSCLRALGCECDAVDVAGATGYAFVLNVPEAVGVWGPTAFQWDVLHEGIPLLGRATAAYYAPEQTEDTYRDAFEFVAREIGAGRPCVINGAFVPEFAAVVAVDDTQYHFVGAMRDEPLAHDALDAPGGVYVLAFPTAVAAEPGHRDRDAINHGVQLLRQTRHPFDTRTTWGLGAWDAWAEELEERRANAWGNSYCAACYAERVAMAQGFVERVAGRHPEAEELQTAATAYLPAVDAMARFCEVFPFPGPAGESISDEINIAEGAELLRAAGAAETEAVVALIAALEVDWG